MIPNTAGSSSPGDDSTGTAISCNANSTGNSTLKGDASLRAVRTRSQERSQYQEERRNPHSHTEIKIAEIGLTFGAAANGIGKGAVALKGAPISATVEIGRCESAGTAHKQK